MINGGERTAGAILEQAEPCSDGDSINNCRRQKGSDNRASAS